MSTEDDTFRILCQTPVARMLEILEDRSDLVEQGNNDAYKKFLELNNWGFEEFAQAWLRHHARYSERRIQELSLNG